jgi:hypothetical protein
MDCSMLSQHSNVLAPGQFYAQLAWERADPTGAGTVVTSTLTQAQQAAVGPHLACFQPVHRQHTLAGHDHILWRHFHNTGCCCCCCCFTAGPLPTPNPCCCSRHSSSCLGVCGCRQVSEGVCCLVVVSSRGHAGVPYWCVCCGEVCVMMQHTTLQCYTLLQVEVLSIFVIGAI